ncbi:hypothetical protein L798_04007 [Zootermopsis nevadensis]|uniref:Uncharacterized protein n=1 Tax=Zootermopsis nevadensis TaxID=136037 RepID=A0A067QQ81_ZOONE|nr:hypothetical protein L798_04007 [Zootermopsis nevadensis]
MHQNSQDLRHELGKVNLELSPKSNSNVLHQKNQSALQWTVNCPENLDKCKDIIKVITNVLFNNSNQDSQLLKKEFSEIYISCSNHI